jgi:hypothetical protein
MPFDGQRPDHVEARGTMAAPRRLGPSEEMCAIGRMFERAMMDLGFRAAQSAEVRELVDAHDFRAALRLLGALAERRGRDPTGWLERIKARVDQGTTGPSRTPRPS